MKSYFFNAEATADLAAHPTGYDREYDADDHAAFFAPFFTAAGVFAGADPDACKVVVEAGTTLRVRPGAVYARGRMAAFDGTETVEAAQDCTVVARMNKTKEARCFQLLSVQTPILDLEGDLYDVVLATAAVTPIIGGHEIRVTDARAFMAFTGQPPYYPPDSQSLPYVLWLYALGFPMTQDQRAAVEENPSLMAIFNASMGAARVSTVPFAAADWTAAGGTRTLAIPRTVHGRQGEGFGFRIWQETAGDFRSGTWAALETDVRYDRESGAVVLDCPDAYSGKIAFFG